MKTAPTGCKPLKKKKKKKRETKQQFGQRRLQLDKLKQFDEMRDELEAAILSHHLH